MSSTTESPWLSVPQIARVVGRSSWWVVQRVDMGELQSSRYLTRTGRIVRRVSRSSFDAWALEHPGLVIETTP